jgi:hypothetical protein
MKTTGRSEKHAKTRWSAIEKRTGEPSPAALLKQERITGFASVHVTVRAGDLKINGSNLKIEH